VKTPQPIENSELSAYKEGERVEVVKSFKAFRLDRANHLLWRNGDRVPIAPKGFDVLSYLVEHAGRVVTQEEILEALWPETYVNPEILRKYIQEIRKALGDRPDNAEFIETLPKRGYRFVAPVTDESEAELPEFATSDSTEELATEDQAAEATIEFEATPPAESRSDKHAQWKLAIVLILVSAGAAVIGAYFRGARSGAKASLNNPSIAVLPFVDISPAKDQEYFADGITDQLISDLAQVSGLRVVGRSSAFQFKGKNEDSREIGRKLGVADVLEGSVRREGNHVRITAELIETNDGFQLWSQTYDHEMKDIFAVQDELARSTTKALQLRLLGGNGHPTSSNSQNTNSDAYQAYLQAEYFTGRGRGKDDLEKALAYTDTALKFDQKYAPAWALRASVENTMAEAELINSAQGYRQARDDAERAIALDPNCARAYLALATNQLDYDWDWDAANGFVSKAVVLQPGSTEVLRVRSNLSWVLGDLDQAIKLRQQAVTLDPLRADSFSDLAYLLYLAGRYNEAQAALQKALDLNPVVGFGNFTLGLIFVAEERPQQALVATDKEQNEWAKLTLRALADHALGHEQDSNAALTELIAKHATDAPFQIAEVYAFRGESNEVFRWLGRAYEERDPGLTIMKTDPFLKPLRHDQRYAQLLTKLHLAR
jgi:TolB-like protein/DNA-binding winged helix-turn-helix (wHTH) protein/Tfp pilus assembly protein PilF